MFMNRSLVSAHVKSCLMTDTVGQRARIQAVRRSVGSGLWENMTCKHQTRFRLLTDEDA